MSLIQISLLCILLCTSSIGWTANIKELYESAVDAFNGQHYDESIAFYQQIIDQAPAFAPAYNGIGLAIKAKDDDYDEAIKYFKQAIKADGRFAQAYENLGRMHYAQGEYTLAQQQFDKALAIDPQLTGSMVNLGWIYLLAKANPAKAIKYFKQAYALESNPNIYFALGMAYFSNNDRVEAIEVVTTLRSLKQDALAEQLETAMRENRRISLDPVVEDKKSAGESPASSVPAASPPPQPSSPSNDVKVRLSGKLNGI